MKTTLEMLKEKIAELRDSEHHVCPNDEWEKWKDEGLKVDEEPACTCRHYDEVIDLIDDCNKESK
tara:strand:- start:193 stop:387 length:195 start_codon:yes stop_codon:yes gene_type:complete